MTTDSTEGPCPLCADRGYITRECLACGGDGKLPILGAEVLAPTPVPGPPGLVEKLREALRELLLWKGRRCVDPACVTCPMGRARALLARTPAASLGTFEAGWAAAIETAAKACEETDVVEATGTMGSYYAQLGDGRATLKAAASAIRALKSTSPAPSPGVQRFAEFAAKLGPLPVSAMASGEPAPSLQLQGDPLEPTTANLELVAGFIDEWCTLDHDDPAGPGWLDSCGPASAILAALRARRAQVQADVPMGGAEPECEDCEEDWSFECVVCGWTGCLDHAGQHTAEKCPGPASPPREPR